MMPSPSEAETEGGSFIFLSFEQAGWEWLAQPIADRRRTDEAPNALLFHRGCEEPRKAAAADECARSRHGSGRLRHITPI